MSVDRRGFLSRVLALGTAPVVAGFIDDASTGLAVPDRSIETAREIPQTLVIGSSLTSIHNLHSGMMLGEFNHTRAHNGDGTIVMLVNGELWAVPAFRVPAGHRLGRPGIREL